MLLDVAAALLVEHGPEGVTMEGVAARAGVSKGLGYIYFENRGELLGQLYDREVAELDRRIAGAVVTAATLEDRLRATMNAWFDLVTERGYVIGELFGSHLIEGPLEERRRRREPAAMAWGAHLAREEHPDLPEREALLSSSILLAAATGTLALWAHQDVPRREAVEIFVTIATGGLAAVAARAAAVDEELSSA